MVRWSGYSTLGRKAAQHIPAWTGSAAMVAAVAIWVAVVLLAGFDRVTGHRPQFQVLLIALAGVDLIVAWRGRRGRVGLGLLLWVFVRAVAAGGGFVLAALPAYVVAIIAWTPDPRRTGTRDGWHPYRPAADAWREAAVPPPFQTNLAGAHANASVACAVCGSGPDAPRHAAPDDAGPGDPPAPGRTSSDQPAG